MAFPPLSSRRCQRRSSARRRAHALTILLTYGTSSRQPSVYSFVLTNSLSTVTKKGRAWSTNHWKKHRQSLRVSKCHWPLPFRISRPSHERNNQWFPDKRTSTKRYSKIDDMTTDTSGDDHEEDDDDDEDYELWESGNVYDDLHKLELAIGIANAPQHLQQQERLETLDYFAQQRRPLLSDLQNYIVRPLGMALILMTVHKFSKRSAQIIDGLYIGASIHFWCLVVAAPLLLLLQHTRRKYHSQITTPDMPKDLQGLDPDYLSFLTVTDPTSYNPRTSCQDHVQSLLEQWTSAVLGMAVLGPILSGSTWRHGLQFLTRAAALVALYQFPKLWFQLIRSQQPRPLERPIYQLQRLTQVQYPFFFLALELSRLLARQSWTSVVCVYALVAVTIGNVLIDQKYGETSNDKKLVLRIRSIQRYAWALCGYWVCRQATPTLLAWSYNAPMILGKLQSSVRYRGIVALRSAAVLVCTAGPVAHLLAFKKLVHLSSMPHLSLTSTPEQFEQQLAQPAILRWRLTWREPRRVRVVLEEWRQQFWYWLFFAGSVQDKLRKELKASKQSEAKKQGLTVWQRVAASRDENPEAPMPDRTRWKRQAMDRLAAKHQKDYEQGTYDDPLGVLVHQTLGIGLGFKFDHMSKPKPGERMTTRRLQARAAKSAARHVQKLYNSVEASEELKGIQDPVEREKRAKAMRQDVQKEIDYLAKRLSDLVPTDLSLDDPWTFRPVEAYTMKDFVKTSSNEFLVRDKTAVEKLLDDNRDDSADTDYFDIIAKDLKAQDDEFIEEWSRQRYGEKDEAIDDDDDGRVDTTLA